jgi:hypothetical protein
MADSGLPPSRFGAGYTVGPPAAAPSGRYHVTPDTGIDAGRGIAAVNASHQPLSQAPIGWAPTVADPPTAGMNPMAVAAFVLALVFGPFVIPITLPMAYVARRQISGSGQGGATLAKAAVLVNLVYLAVGAALLVLYVFVVRPAVPLSG